MSQMLVAFNPKSPTADWQKDGIKYENPMQLERMGAKLRDEIVAERKARGCTEPFKVPIALRGNPKEIRWLNFNPRYAGSLNHATTLYQGNWRIATDEEEAAENARIAGVNVDAARNLIHAFDAAARKTATEPGFAAAVKVLKDEEAKAGVVPPSKVQDKK